MEIVYESNAYNEPEFLCLSADKIVPAGSF